MRKSCSNLAFHAVAIPALVLSVAYIAMDEETRCKVKDWMLKKLKKEEKMIKECLGD